MKEPYDLRSALQQLEAEEGQLLITDKLTDTDGELAGYIVISVEEEHYSVPHSLALQCCLPISKIILVPEF